jgi:glycine cleavage system H protein
MGELFYTKEHQWISVDDSIGTVGITDFAQKQLGELVFIECPEVQKFYSKNEEVAVVESSKAASEVYMPVDGTILEINLILETKPSLINSDPEVTGWIFRTKISDITDLNQLMNLENYKTFLDNSN